MPNTKPSAISFKLNMTEAKNVLKNMIWNLLINYGKRNHCVVANAKSKHKSKVVSLFVILVHMQSAIIAVKE